jgi:hypothetical protein
MTTSIAVAGQPAWRSRLLSLLVVGFTVLMLASLVWGLFDPFFFGADRRSVQGIDFFSTLKAYRNLLERRSMYDTWGGAAHGPYSTWHLMHPAFTLFVASYLSPFSPWVSYSIFTVAALAVLVACAHLMTSLAVDQFEQRMAYVFFLCSFVTYWLLYVGNMHSVAVLSLTLILVGMYELAYGADTRGATHKVAAGLLVSLFSKPVLLLAVPVLLINRSTRGPSVRCLGVYAVVSVACLVVPALNPESVGWRRILAVATDAGFVTRNLNVYANGFVLNEYMKDNAIHWLNILAQSGAYRNHVDIQSLSAFLDSALGTNLPGVVYKLPLLVVLALSAALLLVDDDRERLRISLLVIMASSFSYFLSYNTVWEYQYSSLFPCVAMLFLMHRRGYLDRRISLAVLVLSVFYYLPSPYVLVRHHPLGVAEFNWIRSTRVLPSVVSFVLLAGVATGRIWTDVRTKAAS